MVTNYNLLEILNDEQILNFHNLLASYGYSPTIFEPTRIQKEKRSLLDNFYIKGKVSAFYKIWYFIEAAHAVKSVQTLFEISL